MPLYAWIWLCSVPIFLFVGWVMYMGRKYRNPYLLYMIVAKKGGGKTTMIAKWTQKYRRMLDVFISLRNT